MVNNSVSKTFRFVKNLLVFTPPTEPSRFVLEESGKGEEPNSEGYSATSTNPALAELDTLLRFARRVKQTMQNASKALKNGDADNQIEALKSELAALEKQQTDLQPLIAAYDVVTDEPGRRRLSTSLEENRKIIEKVYCLPENKDLIIRPFTIQLATPVKAMLVFIDGMVSGETLNLAVLRPLMSLGEDGRQLFGAALADYIAESCLPSNQVNKEAEFTAVQTGINSGDTALFIDGVDQALVISSKGWEHRSVDRPQTEQTVRGSQASFTENLRVNTGLIRTILRSSDLVTEMFPVGTRSRVNCAVMYLKSVANPTLVAEVKRRIKNINTDYVDDSGVLDQFIQEQAIIPLPLSLSTERPDRVASHLVEGRVGIIMEGSPFAHVVPVNFFTFFHSGEDFSLNPVAATFLRILRFLGATISILLPAFYIAITYFHQEALPTELILAIAGARENVPFPAIVEVATMELAFELIREAGLRIPGVLGSTIGIVGAIILGQAAVAAHIVSPIIVIIVAITGLAGSIIPEYRMALTMRLARFGFLVVAVTFGLVGVGSMILISLVTLCHMKSFGVPYMEPITPKTASTLDVVVRGPVQRQEKRPDALNTLDETAQPPVSKKWMKKLPAGEKDK
jgi:spore germination protein KA